MNVPEWLAIILKNRGQAWGGTEWDKRILIGKKIFQKGVGEGQEYGEGKAKLGKSWA